MCPMSLALRRISVLAGAAQKCARRWDRQNGRSRSILQDHRCGHQLEIGSGPVSPIMLFQKAKSSGLRVGQKLRCMLDVLTNNGVAKLTSRNGNTVVVELGAT